MRPFISLLCHSVLCTVPQTNALEQLAFSRCPCAHTVVKKHMGHPSTHRGQWPSHDSPPQMPLSQDPFLQSPGWLTNCWFIKWTPYAESRERPKKEADHSRLVDGKFNKQGSLHTRLVLGNCKMSRSPHPPTRILNVYTEALTGLSHEYCPDDLNNTLLSQACVLEMALAMGTVGEAYIPKTGEGVRSLRLPRAISRVNQQSHLYDLLRNTAGSQKCLLNE